MPQSLPLYTFSCFKVSDQVCNEMDTIIRAFWWGYGQGEKKLHLLNWEKICQPKRKGGLGIKNFGPMNPVMLAKQYWNLYQNPNSLLVRTYKVKYYPNYYKNTLQSLIILGVGRILLSRVILDLGRGNGELVLDSISHLLIKLKWFPSSHGNLHHPELQTGTVGDLIDHNSKTWKADLV